MGRSDSANHAFQSSIFGAMICAIWFFGQLYLDYSDSQGPDTKEAFIGALEPSEKVKVVVDYYRGEVRTVKEDKSRAILLQNGLSMFIFAVIAWRLRHENSGQMAP